MDEIQHSENAKSGEFIAVIAHQLRTPLSVIKFVADELLHEKALITERQRHKVQAIADAAERALNLVNGLLNIAALPGAGAVPEFAECDLRASFESVIDGLRPIAAAKNQRIVFSAPHDMPEVRVCNEYLTRAFQNILDNAIQYGDENSEIAVTLRQDEREYVAYVHNFGPAIPKEEIPNIFKKFHRLPEAEKIKPSGSGLGLFIAKAAVELNGGRVWIASEVEQGTTVYFTVPLGT
ncbi:MAG: HAMP domain-containing histidine kinase [Candidatus Harrisonbacteria bacterium]|nr:HAMP domain-containing histidine kinase [Candidatus Harrisonbacteria bacterium]MBI3114405.1 HAMP domain-containing histidine kinase [Candidatus Harrisonbacteria bacterium]